MVCFCFNFLLYFVDKELYDSCNITALLLFHNYFQKSTLIPNIVLVGLSFFYQSGRSMILSIQLIISLLSFLFLLPIEEMLEEKQNKESYMNECQSTELLTAVVQSFLFQILTQDSIYPRQSIEISSQPCKSSMEFHVTQLNFLPYLIYRQNNLIFLPI